MGRLKPEHNQETEQPTRKFCWNSGNINYDHFTQMIDIDIWRVYPSGITELIGKGWSCEFRTFDSKNKKHIECCREPKLIKRFATWPKEIDEMVWTMLAAAGPSYWMQWGWNITKTQSGQWRNFKDENYIPPYEELDDLNPKAMRMLKFRAMRDPTMPGKLKDIFLKAKLSVVFDDPTPQNQTVNKLVNKIMPVTLSKANQIYADGSELEIEDVPF